MAPSEILLRLAASVVVGFIFGIEREAHGRAAGLRTTILVCVAAALAALLSEYFLEDLSPLPDSRPDPLRLGAGLFAGIGFLGAGTIIRQGSIVRGVTTAAILWFVTMIGLCFGSGAFLLGTAGSAAALLPLWTLPAIERRLSRHHYATLVLGSSRALADDPAFRRLLASHSVLIQSANLRIRSAGGDCKATFRVRYRGPERPGLAENLVPQLARLPGVSSVKWQGES